MIWDGRDELVTERQRRQGRRCSDDGDDGNADDMTPIWL
jgi:hypothetical protein